MRTTVRPYFSLSARERARNMNELDELGRPASHVFKEEVSPAGPTVRIRDVEALLLDGKYPFVLVHTEDGLTGIGECDTFSAKLVKPTVQQVLKPLLVGRNA